VLRRFKRVVVLGGAKHHGTMTPVSETNFLHDPVAAEMVLRARPALTLVLRDAHRAFVLREDDVAAISAGATAAARYLAGPMSR
jgi:inosine-uridine nucleoside N-ribohydrolase